MLKTKKAKLDLTYRVLIEKETYKDGSLVYVANVPSLGISDYGETIEEAIINTEKLIKFHLESLIKEGEEIPESDNSDNIIVTTTKISLNSPKRPVLV